jgi:single-strand DNA-binding protein
VRDEDGSWTQKPNFVNVTVFGPNAEYLSRSLTKGSRIAVDGRLSWREWTTDSGSKGQALDVVANNVHYLDTKAEADARRTADTSAPAPGDATEDIPF